MLREAADHPQFQTEHYRVIDFDSYCRVVENLLRPLHKHSPAYDERESRVGRLSLMTFHTLLTVDKNLSRLQAFNGSGEGKTPTTGWIVPTNPDQYDGAMCYSALLAGIPDFNVPEHMILKATEANNFRNFFHEPAAYGIPKLLTDRLRQQGHERHVKEVRADLRKAIEHKQKAAGMGKMLQAFRRKPTPKKQPIAITKAMLKAFHVVLHIRLAILEDHWQGFITSGPDLAARDVWPPYLDNLNRLADVLDNNGIWQAYGAGLLGAFGDEPCKRCESNMMRERLRRVVGYATFMHDMMAEAERVPVEIEVVSS
jgi:hypothetical protein